MLQSNFWRRRSIRVLLLILILILLTILFLAGDSVTKMRSRHFMRPCILCPLKGNVTFNNFTTVLHFSAKQAGKSKGSETPIHILFFFSHLNRNPSLKNKFFICIESLFKHATHPLHLHILTDNISVNTAVETLQDAVSTTISLEVTLYDVNVLLEPLQPLIISIRPFFSFKQGAYYSDGLFFISIGLFKLISLERLIVVDADVKFLDDIKNLYDQFKNFSSETVIGIAREQQPVYRHIMHEYRHLNNDTKIGDPPPDGMPGFNSGVLLLELGKMRTSNLYASIADNFTLISQLIEKYKFKGHLGDQDFYTLISFEYPNLFYSLPCTWNRQLCQWWKHHGYKDVFELYHSCNGTVHLLHGNCNTFIPDS